MIPDASRCDPFALATVLQALRESAGVLVIGGPGTGKTSLLYRVAIELEQRGTDVVLISLEHRDSETLGEQILRAVSRSRFQPFIANRSILRSSSGTVDLRETAEILRGVEDHVASPPVLLIDELPPASRMAGAVEALSADLTNWKFVVASRSESDVGYFPRFVVVELRPLSPFDAASFILERVPDLPDDIVRRAVDASSGNPLMLRLMADALRSNERFRLSFDETLSDSLGSRLRRLIEETIELSPNPAAVGDLIAELALSGGREHVRTLAARADVSEVEAQRLLADLVARSLVVYSGSAETVDFAHPLIREVVLSEWILRRSFRLNDLIFGSEEAERDELLDQCFVRNHSLNAILQHGRSLVVGDRGSGKSAIFRRIAAGDVSYRVGPEVDVYPLANTGDLLHRIVDKDAWLNTEDLRAAWLVVVASVISASLPTSAPKKVLRSAVRLRAGLGFPPEHRHAVRRVFGTILSPLRGTSLKFSVGPVNLETKLPSSELSNASKAPVDIDTFLKEANSLLMRSAKRVVVMIDRVDEIFKYDRPKQQSLVQALLQAEAHISMLSNIGLMIFLRSDLFELYDIQEKNKLVSRTLAIKWSEDEWLRALVKRVLVNRPLQALAERLHINDDKFVPHHALKVVFPSEVEGQPIEQWLLDSLRNGNGHISPRLAVLLLHLTRDLSSQTDAYGSTLPLFTSEALMKAMTSVSDLSFSEIVNDFKIASTFVLNCRAGKLKFFTLEDVSNLFDPSEGKVGDQVRLLERLGFLERVVEQQGTDTKSLFRIPKLYTRCWDYA